MHNLRTERFFKPVMINGRMALEVQAPLDGPCSCATAYGREAGKVVP
jgi:hypothetical protein